MHTKFTSDKVLIYIRRNEIPLTCVAVGENDSEDRGAVLSLRESFGNYCLEVLKCVERSHLDSVLVKCCNEKSIKFFWQVVQEREPDYISFNDRSR